MQVGLLTIILLMAANLVVRPAECADKGVDPASQITADDKQPTVDRKIITDSIDWITAKTGWPIDDVPAITFATPAQLNELQFGKSAGSNGITCKALYKRASQTICLSNAWNLSDLRDRSYLLHELVHHLQDLNQTEAACDGAREMQAYRLQFDWLGKQGIRDPQAFLGISDMVLFMMTQCPLYRACEFLPGGCRD